MPVSDLTELNRKIEEIGNRMAACDLHCSGIRLSPSDGIPPRCLYLEIEGRQPEKDGSVVVGLNSGPAKPRETSFYRPDQQGKVDYDQTVSYLRLRFEKQDTPYYKKLHLLIGELNLLGPILWTEVVKCESDKKPGSSPLWAVGTCAREYLRYEMELVPSSWPLVAAGADSFKYLQYAYPDRLVVGIPHPTGSFGQFSHLFNEQQQLHRYIRSKFQEARERSQGAAVWLVA